MLANTGATWEIKTSMSANEDNIQMVYVSKYEIYVRK